MLRAAFNSLLWCQNVCIDVILLWMERNTVFDFCDTLNYSQDISNVFIVLAAQSKWLVCVHLPRLVYKLFRALRDCCLQLMS